MRPRLVRKRCPEETKSGRIAKKTKDILNSYEFMNSENSSDGGEGDDDDFIEYDDLDAHNVLTNEGILVDVGDALMEAFVILRSGKVSDFLNTEIIQRTFTSAYQLLASFGLGTTLMTKIWRLKWFSDVKSSEVMAYKDCCQACGRMRMIRYKITRISTRTTLAFLGGDCYEVKMKALFDLIDFCFEVPLQSDDIRDGLDECLTRIREAPIRMHELYANRFDKTD